jgi:hypothetical protein
MTGPKLRGPNHQNLKFRISAGHHKMKLVPADSRGGCGFDSRVKMAPAPALVGSDILICE